MFYFELFSVFLLTNLIILLWLTIIDPNSLSDDQMLICLAAFIHMVSVSILGRGLHHQTWAGQRIIDDIHTKENITIVNAVISMICVHSFGLYIQMIVHV